MPFGAEGTPEYERNLKIYQQMIKPVVEECGYITVRADELEHVGSITRDIIELLYEVDLVIADLSGKNANVFYELGVRHALYKYGTIPIIRQGESLPFDIANYRAIAYSSELDGPNKFIEKLKKRITSIDDKKTKKSDNPVHDTLHNYLKFNNIKEHVSKYDYDKKIAEVNELTDKIVKMKSGVKVLKDTNEFYRQLIAIITPTSKVDVTYFTPNIPTDFYDEDGSRYWDTINKYLMLKTGFRLRRISTVETPEQLNWLLNTIIVSQNPPGYHLHYLDAVYGNAPLNVNIIDEEHVLIFGPEARSKSTEYIYLRDKHVARTMQRYFDLMWENTPVLGESGRLNSKAIVKLKQNFGIADGSPNPIGIFDSGIGGLSVVKEIRKLLPNEDIIYVADQANIPYGERVIENVKEIADGVVRFLIDQEVKLIVIACNTATAVSLKWLREQYPHIWFIGVVPAVKPAAEASKKRKIGVLATPATFSTQLFDSLVADHAKDMVVIRCELPKLVNAIEQGDLRTPSTKKLLRDYIEPLIKDVDSIVLGCTHFVFVKDQIQSIVGSKIDVIDSSEAIARQVSNILQNKGLANVDDDEVGKLIIFTSGQPNALRLVIRQLGIEADRVENIGWDDGKLQKKENDPTSRSSGCA